VHASVKATKPSVKISAAVFPNATSAYDGVGQDWRQWVADGLLDFICPMDYTSGLNNFTNLIAQQIDYVAGKMPIYPGIGAFILEPDACLAQIQANRAADTGGFILFELSPDSARNLLPIISLGATAPDEPDIDADLLPDAWEVRWFGTLNTAGLDSDSDGDHQTDRQEYITGTDPTLPVLEPLLHARATGGTVEISFNARAASGQGYQNAQRHYRLESAASPAGAPWQTVPGFADRTIPSAVETLTLSLAALPGPAQFYRLCVWLQEKPR
jgi:hypothetical protein